VRIRGLMGAVAVSAIASVALTACGASDSGDSKSAGASGSPSASTGTPSPAGTGALAAPSPPDTATPATSAPATPTGKLAAKWKPRLAEVDKGSARCDDAGSNGCFQQMSDLLDVMSPLLQDIEANQSNPRYLATPTEISKISKAVSDYSKRMCMQDVHANDASSPCSSDAKTVKAGPNALEADESAPIG
jgi:hypothetical protein